MPGCLRLGRTRLHARLVRETVNARDLEVATIGVAVPTSRQPDTEKDVLSLQCPLHFSGDRFRRCATGAPRIQMPAKIEIDDGELKLLPAFVAEAEAIVPSALLGVAPVAHLLDTPGADRAQ